MKNTLTLLMLLVAISTTSFAQINDCQTIIPILSSSAPSVQPDPSGWIDLCIGEPLQLNGDAQFPENDVNYSQSVFTSAFSWSLGDGTVLEGQNISYTYPAPGAYYVNLFVRDEMGCTSDTDLHIRVRVAAPPVVAIAQNPPIAELGTPVSLKAVVAPAAVYSFSDQLFFGIATPLPDGNGAYVDMPLMVSGYPAGATLEPSQIESICVNMEHTWLRDLELKLTCPSGQSAILHNFAGQTGGEVFLGEPFAQDEGFPVPVPGVGYDYCWTASPEFNQTWIQYANSHSNVGILPTGSYYSFEQLDSLAGCPLNGTWNFTSVDLWAIDNGYLFNWSMSFDTTNFTNPSEESFSAITSTAAWEQDPSIIYYSADSIVAVPQMGSQYVFKSSNDFGCADEMAFSINCVVDTTIDGTHCFSENYSIVVNGVIYDSSHPSGLETIPLPNGCDSVITIDLVFIDQIATELSYHYCQGDCVPDPAGNLICDDMDFVYNLVSMNGCDSVVTVHFIFDFIEVNNIIRTCDAFGQNYTVSFEIVGSDSSCTIGATGGSLIGGVFTSNPIPSGTPYSFEISCTVCQPIIVEGIFNCSCVTDAGNMNSTVLEVCEGEMAVAAYPSNVNLDPNDALCFALVQTIFGTPITKSNTPEFSFIPGIMDYGTTYYIVAIAGNDDGTGCVDYIDPCFDISNATPVVFIENTTINAVANYDTFHCLGDDLVLNGSGGTGFLWTGPGNFVSTQEDPIISNITQEQTGSYQLVVFKTCAQPDTIEIVVDFDCIYLADTIQLNEVGNLLCQYDVGSSNQCPETDQSASLNFDLTLECLFYTGNSIGIDTICLIAQNNVGDIVPLRLFLTVVEPSAVVDLLPNNLVDIFPNPTNDAFFVRIVHVQPVSLDVYDMTGRFVQQYSINGHQTKINTTDWVEGAYILKFTTPSGVVGKRILVTH